jgi:protein phosphatase
VNIPFLTRRRHTERHNTDNRTVARTDRGLKRSENQDAVLVRELPDGSVVAAVADGVGGASGGELASAGAIESLLAELWVNPCAAAAASLYQAVASANAAVRAEAAERGLEGMATTLVAAVVRDGSAWVANVGDSRAYLYEAGTLRQLTQDHSWVAEQVQAGRLTEEEAETNAFRNVITRAVGVAETVEPDVSGPIPLPAGSLLLLCSDGLHRAVSGAAIADALASGGPGGMADRLIALANEAGGPDNVSVVIVRGE